MPTSNNSFDNHTTAKTVASTYSDNVKDKTILITGANPGGIGIATAVALASASPKMLIIAGRNKSRLDQTAQGIKEVNPNVSVKQITLDLGSQESCRKAAESVMNDSSISQIDILINNAGIMNLPERQLSPEGIEMQLATNHVGHYLFTNLITPKILKAAESAPAGATRIVNLSSRAVNYSAFRFSDYNFTKKEAELPAEERLSQQTRQQWSVTEDLEYIPQASYGQSKTANVLFSVGLNKRLQEKGVLSVAVHPGLVGTELGRNMDPEVLQGLMSNILKMNIPGMHLKNLEEGSSTTVVAALDPKVNETDILLDNCQSAAWCPEYAKNPEKAEKLWKLSEELVGQTFAY